MKNRGGMVIVALVAIVALCMAFQWEERTYVEPGQGPVLLRTNRFSGTTEQFTPNLGWVRLDSRQRHTSDPLDAAAARIAAEMEARRIARQNAEQR